MGFGGEPVDLHAFDQEDGLGSVGEVEGKRSQPSHSLLFCIRIGDISPLEHALDVGGKELMGVALAVAKGRNFAGADALVGEGHDVEDEGGAGEVEESLTVCIGSFGSGLF